MFLYYVGFHVFSLKIVRGHYGCAKKLGVFFPQVIIYCTYVIYSNLSQSDTKPKKLKITIIISSKSSQGKTTKIQKGFFNRHLANDESLYDQSRLLLLSSTSSSHSTNNIDHRFVEMRFGCIRSRKSRK